MPEAQTATIRRLGERKAPPTEPTEGIESPKRAASVPPLRNFENISGGELARWIKITAPWNARIAAAVAVLDRGWGKPTQALDANLSFFDGLTGHDRQALLAVLEAIEGN
jgi:hypothetical protein